MESDKSQSSRRHRNAANTTKASRRNRGDEKSGIIRDMGKI